MKTYCQIIFSVMLFLFIMEINIYAKPLEVILINKKNNQLAYVVNREIIHLFPVATGKYPDVTPDGIFTIHEKITNRPYYKKNIKGGDPKNPLGKYWIGISNTLPGYGIHGTTNPQSIGRYITQGCVRLKSHHLEMLYNKVTIGTQIHIYNSPLTFKKYIEQNLKPTKNHFLPKTKTVTQSVY